MSHDKKKAHSTVGAAEQAVGNGRADTSSCDDFNAVGGNSQQQSPGLVSSVLLKGEAKAIPGKDLVKILGLKDLRELTRLVERERQAGVPICASVSGERGYYLAGDTAELERYIKSLDRRLKNVRGTREAVQDAYIRMTDQMEIEE